MTFDRDIESFIKNYVKALKEKNAVAFIGAGMSVSQGFITNLIYIIIRQTIIDRKR